MARIRGRGVPVAKKEEIEKASKGGLIVDNQNKVEYKPDDIVFCEVYLKGEYYGKKSYTPARGDEYFIKKIISCGSKGDVRIVPLKVTGKACV